MIWIYLILAFSFGIIVGWALCYYNDENRCPDRTYHDFEYMGETIEERTGYVEPSSYELGGYYTYEVKVKRYRCKKCGYIKKVEKQ